MKQVIIFSFLLASCFLTHGQLLQSFLVDENGWETDSASAQYKRSISLNDLGELRFEDLGISDGLLYRSGGAIADTLIGGLKKGVHLQYFRNGLCTDFFANGKKKREGTYVKNVPLGVFYEWYANGRRKAAYQYDDHQGQPPSYDHDYRVISFFDESGKQLVTKGTGRYLEETENSKGEGRVVFGLKNGFWKGIYTVEGVTYAYEEFYRSGVLDRGMSISADGQSRKKYKEIKTPTKYQDGMYSFYSFISRNLRYPKSARKDRIQGEVYVLFTVDENGRTEEIEVIRGLNEDCNALAVRAIDRADQFTAASYRGRKVRTKMMIPVAFSPSNF